MDAVNCIPGPKANEFAKAKDSPPRQAVLFYNFADEISPLTAKDSLFIEIFSLLA
jgi:hypothetical protein